MQYTTLTKQLKMRATPDEMAAWHDLAASQGETLTSLIRGSLNEKLRSADAGRDTKAKTPAISSAVKTPGAKNMNSNRKTHDQATNAIPAPPREAAYR